MSGNKMDSACGKNTREMAYGSRQNKVLRALLLIRMWSNMHAYAPHDQITFTSPFIFIRHI